jgi:dCTP deaminase
VILSDAKILEEMENGNIVIEPFDKECLGPNSYDIHLGTTLAQYEKRIRHTIRGNFRIPLDSARPNPVVEYDIRCKCGKTPCIGDYDNGCGTVLEPGEFYLASTLEYTETRGYVPYVDGKSSIGRLGIMIHLTAGRGDAGFFNHWTLEVMVAEPVIVYRGMPFGQITYHSMLGDILETYDKKRRSKYGSFVTGKPVPSMMWKNFQPSLEPVCICLNGEPRSPHCAVHGPALLSMT